MFLKYLLHIQCSALLPNVLFDYDKKGEKYIIAYLRKRRDFTKRGRYKNMELTLHERMKIIIKRELIPNALI